MAKKRKKSRKGGCGKGLKRNGRLAKGFKFKKGSRCPVKVSKR